MDVPRVLHSPVCLALLSTIQVVSAVRRSLPKENVSGHACGHAAASAIHLSSSLSLWSPSQCATVHTSVTTDYTNHKQIIKVLSNETYWIPLAGRFQKCLLPSVSQLSTAFKSSLKVFFKFQVIQSPVNQYNSKDHDIKGKQGLPSNSTPEISSHGYLLITQEEYRFNNYNFLNYQKNM